ncbi:MAG: hypothetical protein ABIS50_16650 [Luteolibacter sp.]
MSVGTFQTLKSTLLRAAKTGGATSTTAAEIMVSLHKTTHPASEADTPACCSSFPENFEDFREELPEQKFSVRKPDDLQVAGPERMNRKPVIYRPAKTVLNTKSLEFSHKLLCDGLTLNFGDACVFLCAYCYVGPVMRQLLHKLIAAYNKAHGTSFEHQDFVIRREHSLELLRKQLIRSNGQLRFFDPNDNRVVYSSTLVDVAANMEILRETAAACVLILESTNWQIRLLSKSSLLSRLISEGMIPEKFHHRMIFGFSTGTLDERVVRAVEGGTSPVSKRLKSLHWLQDHGLRTFGMICPSLPQQDYDGFSREMCDAIRSDRCEHVWAEVINVRGKSYTRTLAALHSAGLNAEAMSLSAVAGPRSAERWEEYARQTFLSHTKNIPPEKLRYLQYINPGSADWWASMRDKGAVLLGSTAKKSNLTYMPTMTNTMIETEVMSDEDLQFRETHEGIVTNGVKASMAAAAALYQIHSYKEGLLWNSDFESFDAYCRAKWDYGKSHSYRLVECGEFMAALANSQSPKGDQPQRESQVRPLMELPKERRVKCWNRIVAETPAKELTGKIVAKVVKDYRESAGITISKPLKSSITQAKSGFLRLKKALGKFEDSGKFKNLLDQLEKLIDAEAEGQMAN